MTTPDLLTEAEATSLAGVSARTLRRFQESGYLEVSSAADGSTRYRRDQIVEIFGAAEALGTSPARQDESAWRRMGAATSDERAAPPPAGDGQAPSAADEDEEPASSREAARLRNVVALQERILDMKESEIADLRSQRDWLKARVERLEEKGERDQILLLSETQTIRKLVAYQESRRSPFQNILEWLGIARQPEVRALSAPDDYEDTVEVKPAANS